MRPENEHFRGQNTGERPIRTRQELWEEIGRLRDLAQDIGEAQAAQLERSLGRISALESYLPAQEEPTIVRVKDLEIYLGRGDVFRAGRRIHFTFQEFKLISALSGTPGETVTKEILIQALDLGEYERGAAANNLKVTIQHIRKKFGERAKQPRYVATSWGHGYRLLTD